LNLQGYDTRLWAWPQSFFCECLLIRIGWLLIVPLYGILRQPTEKNQYFYIFGSYLTFLFVIE
jgi:hypothetical protein